MDSYNLFYVSLLGNVNHTIQSIDFGNGFSVEEWSRSDFVTFIANMEHISVHEIDLRLNADYGYKDTDKHVYVLTKKFVWPFHIAGHVTGQQSFEELIPKMAKSFKEMKKQSEMVERVIRKLRLWKEGSIKVPLECYYSYRNNQPFMESMSTEGLHGAERLYEIGESEAPSINAFLQQEISFPTDGYTLLALEHFELSYRIWPSELEFITLMIVMETLFNDGNAELSLRISRGCAVLLGTSVEHSQKIFDNVKSLYKKRSTLIHTGDKKKITPGDLLLLKKYVREALRRILVLGVEKLQLSKQLLRYGFGDAEKIQ